MSLEFGATLRVGIPVRLLLQGPCYTVAVTFRVQFWELEGFAGLGVPIWEFPKIGDANIVPQIVGSLLSGPRNKLPLISGNSHLGFGLWGFACGGSLQGLWLSNQWFRV